MKFPEFNERVDVEELEPFLEVVEKTAAKYEPMILTSQHSKTEGTILADAVEDFTLVSQIFFDTYAKNKDTFSALVGKIIARSIAKDMSSSHKIGYGHKDNRTFFGIASYPKEELRQRFGLLVMLERLDAGCYIEPNRHKGIKLTTSLITSSPPYTFPIARVKDEACLLHRPGATSVVLPGDPNSMTFNAQSGVALNLVVAGAGFPSNPDLKAPPIPKCSEISRSVQLV
jgi:hypothetical protein